MTRGTASSVLAIALALAPALAACGQANEEPAPVVRPEPHHDAERFAAGALSFSKYCALCHAKDATGYAADHAPSLVSETFLASASDEHIARGIREGRPGTAMAPYGKQRGGPLDDDEVRLIVDFLRDGGPARVVIPPGTVVGDPSRGAAVFEANCKRCHGTRYDRGEAVHLGNPMLLASATDGFLRYAIVHGRPGTPMPSFQGVLSPREIDDVVALLRSWSIAPEPPPRTPPPDPPPLGQFIINPNGKPADLTIQRDRFVPIAEVKRVLDEKKRIVIIDARPVSEWYAGRIPGSISVPYYALNRLDAMPRDGTFIIAYCACPHHASGVVVDELRKRGFKQSAIADEGILEWKKRGYPIVSEKEPPPPGR